MMMLSVSERKKVAPGKEKQNYNNKKQDSGFSLWLLDWM